MQESNYEKLKKKIEKIKKDSSISIQDELFRLAINITRKNIPKTESKKKKDLYDLLIENGLDIHKKDNKGNNFFYYVKSSFEQEYFLNKGLSPTEKNNENAMMLEFLHVESLRKILKNGLVVPENDFSKNNTHAYLKNRGRTFVKIKDYIKNINMKDLNGENIAFLTNSHQKIIKDLIDAGVDFHMLNNKNETILFKSSIRKLEALIDLNIKINIDQKNCYGETVFDKHIEKLNNLLSNSRTTLKELMLGYRKMNTLIKYAKFMESSFPLEKIIHFYQSAPLSCIEYKSEFENIVINDEIIKIKKNIISEDNPKKTKRL